jgi:hypothetical protein
MIGGNGLFDSQPGLALFGVCRIKPFPVSPGKHLVQIQFDENAESGYVCRRESDSGPSAASGSAAVARRGSRVVIRSREFPNPTAATGSGVFHL